MLDPQDWPSSDQEIKVLSELKTQEMALVSSLLTPSVTTHFPWDRFSSFSKLKRTMAFMLRFIGNCSKAKCDRGALVLLKEKHTPPTQWKLGRIIELHKGADGVARLLSLKPGPEPSSVASKRFVHSQLQFKGCNAL
nr:unnamed protein product [Callosobruchus analis]